MLLSGRSQIYSWYLVANILPKSKAERDEESTYAQNANFISRATTLISKVSKYFLYSDAKSLKKLTTKITETKSIKGNFK